MDTEPIMRELASRLRAERARLDLTLKEAAEKSGVHYVTISKYESGKKLPTMDALLKLAKAYGVLASQMIAEAEAAQSDTAKKAKLKKPAK